ncbi:MAG TPA: porin [Fluviicoccus sp.]|nr:porin [Fluviicoccus sp.]
MSMRTLPLIILAASVSGMVPEASAGSFTAGLDYGWAKARKYCDNITNCSDSDRGVKAEAGYEFNDNIGVELGYTSFGTIFDSKDNQFSASQKSSAVTLSVLGVMPLSDMFNIYGRAGMAHYKTDSSGSVQGVPVKDENGNSLLVGAGVNLLLNEAWSLRAEYQVYANIARADGRKDDVHGVYAGFVYRM